jgi:hypothetical protein
MELRNSFDAEQGASYFFSMWSISGGTAKNGKVAEVCDLHLSTALKVLDLRRIYPGSCANETII